MKAFLGALLLTFMAAVAGIIAAEELHVRAVAANARAI